MLPLLNTSIAMVLTLALLLEMLALPFVALWVLLSIRRSLARMADSLEFKADVERAFNSLGHPDPIPESVTRKRRIANSLFGR